MEGCTPAALLARLAELGIETKTVYHPAAPTVAEHSVHVAHLGGGQAKQLFMRDKGGSFFLVSCLIDTEVDLKVLSERLGFKASKPLRLTPYDVMTRELRVAPGAVTPFAVINCDISVRLLLDARFQACEHLLFHPLTNDATTLVSPAGLVAFLASLGRQAEWVDFSLGAGALIAPPAP